MTAIHGHTYFIRELRIDVSMIPLEWDDPEQDNGMTIDFGEIKKYFKTFWDHMFLIPEKDLQLWQQVYRNTADAAVKNNLFVMRHTTAEWMANRIRAGLLRILQKEMDNTPYEAVPEMIHFQLWEGPHQAIEV